MIGFRVGSIGNIGTARGNFFDRDKVLKAASRAERRNLSFFGAAVRTRAISSMLGHTVRRGFGAKSKVTNRQGVSEPGRPPFPHLGLIPKFLFFMYEQERHSVIIGPAQLGRSPQAMKALEEGGQETIQEGRAGHRTARRAFIRARPFMRPAFDAEIAAGSAVRPWANSVTA